MKMGTATRSIALAAAVAGTMLACSTGGAPCNAELVIGDDMPDLEVQVGDTVKTDLADYLAPTECALRDWRFEASSSDPAVAVSVSRNVLTTVAIDMADSVRVVVDTEYAMHPLSHEFLVRVRPPSAGR